MPKSKKPKNLSSKYQPWIDARKRFRLSHAHIHVRSIEEMVADKKRKEAERKARKQEPSPQPCSDDDLPF